MDVVIVLDASVDQGEFRAAEGASQQLTVLREAVGFGMRNRTRLPFQRAGNVRAPSTGFVSGSERTSRVPRTISDAKLYFKLGGVACSVTQSPQLS